MNTPVIFKLEGKDAVAFFPQVPGTYDPYTCACYAHLGQHGSADAHYARSLRAAKPEQYADLLKELRAIGYEGLVIRSRFTKDDLAARKEALRAQFKMQGCA